MNGIRDAPEKFGPKTENAFSGKLQRLLLARGVPAIKVQQKQRKMQAATAAIFGRSLCIAFFLPKFFCASLNSIIASFCNLFISDSDC